MLSSIVEPIANLAKLERSKEILNDREILRKVFVASCGCHMALNPKSSHIDYPVWEKSRWCINTSGQTGPCVGNQTPSISLLMA